MKTKSTFNHLPYFEDYAGFFEPDIVKRDIFSSAKLKHFDFISRCQQADFSSEIEDSENEEFVTHVDSKYYDIEEINDLQFNSSTSLGICHINIASLEAHIDDLRLFLSRIDHKFEVIGLTEHKIRNGTEPASNIDLAGYEK